MRMQDLMARMDKHRDAEEEQGRVDRELAQTFAQMVRSEMLDLLEEKFPPPRPELLSALERGSVAYRAPYHNRFEVTPQTPTTCALVLPGRRLGSGLPTPMSMSRERDHWAFRINISGKGRQFEVYPRDHPGVMTLVPIDDPLIDQTYDSANPVWRWGALRIDRAIRKPGHASPHIAFARAIPVADSDLQILWHNPVRWAFNAAMSRVGGAS